MKFAAVKLLKRAPVENTEKRHLRELILLALRIATLVLLALAFARPFFATGAASASSGVTVVAPRPRRTACRRPGRFERAKQLAKDAIARAPAGDLVGVVTFADEAEIVAKPTEDRVLAAAAVDQAAPGFGATRYRGGAVGRRADPRRPPRRRSSSSPICRRTAGTRATARRCRRARIEVADVGAMPPEPGGRRGPAASRSRGRHGAQQRTRARVTRTRASPSTAGRPATRPCRSAPNQSADATFAGAPRGAGRGGRRATMRTGFRPTTCATRCSAARSQSVAAGRQRQRRSRPRSVLRAARARRRRRRRRRLSGAERAPGRSCRHGATIVWLRMPAVLLLSTRGLERRGREALARTRATAAACSSRPAPTSTATSSPTCSGAGRRSSVVTATGQKPEPRGLAPADVRHPVFQPFARERGDAGPRDVSERRRGSAAPRCQTLARFTTGDEALVECPAGDGRALVLRVRSRQPLERFSAARDVRAVPARGRAVSGERAGACARVFRRRRAGGALRTPGVVTLAAAPGASRPAAPRRVAINVDPREADPARMSVDDFQSAVTRLKDVGGVRGADRSAPAGGSASTCGSTSLALMARAARGRRDCSAARTVDEAGARRAVRVGVGRAGRST